MCIYSHRTADTILFYHQGGVDIGDVDAKALKLEVPVGTDVTAESIEKVLLTEVAAGKKKRIASFVYNLYKLYVDLYFTYLEINPLVVTDSAIYILDLAAKVDATADFICRPKWGEIDYPPPFGRDAYPEEAYIADLDAKSGASLKLTILNRNGRIWTMVAGGGASVIYSDTICDLGGASELANYGEYSGAPSEQQTYEYAKTILSLMTSSPKHKDGKVLITGGGIANFTNVAATFSGIITALREFQQRLIEHNVSIFVRRAGPNYQEGLRKMREIGSTLGKHYSSANSSNSPTLTKRNLPHFRHPALRVWSGNPHDRHLRHGPRPQGHPQELQRTLCHRKLFAPRRTTSGGRRQEGLRSR